MQKRGWLILLVLLCSLLILPPAFAERVNRALLVGCDRFVSQEDMTPASELNVTRMSEALSSGAMNLETLVTRRSDLSSVAELEDLMNSAFADADEDDVSYFYISTHGRWTPEQPCEEAAFLLSDGNREEALTAATLRELLDVVPGTKVLILDACNSGAVIGKGIESGFSNIFQGSDYKVICSSGGAEESWFWATAEGSEGAGYFSSVLTAGISAAGAFAADSNGDGAINLSELKQYLRRNHGASTPHVYPEEDDFALFYYDAQAVTGLYRTALISGFSLADNLIDGSNPMVSLSFTALRQFQLGYQLVFYEDNGWMFEEAEFLPDTAPGEPGYGLISPGMKERTLSLQRENETSSGYALLQLYSLDGGRSRLLASPVLCITPLTADLSLSVETQKSFTPSAFEELAILAFHSDPCALTVRVETLEGETVSRIASRTASRPEKLRDGGSFFCWNGQRTDGSPAEAGQYRIHVTAYIGSERVDAYSEPFELLSE